MTGAAEARDGATLRPRADERLLPYCLIALGGLAGAVIAGQPGLAALAVPFVLALTLGLRRTAPVRVDARIVIDADQLLEGDHLTGRLELARDGGRHLDVMLFRLHGVASVDGDTLAWSLPRADRAVELPFQLTATRWGLHVPFEVWVRLASPFGLLTWTGRVAVAPTVRVLPSRERLTRLLDPSESRAVAGMHRSRRLGVDGEFAEVRPYLPGDRVRDLNWGATARFRRPFVNSYHPELSGDVVLAIDAFGDGSTGSAEALSRAARAVWTLASVHLRANDRVGLVGLGGRTASVLPAGGNRSRYRLLETLLRIGGEAARHGAARSDRVRGVPASSLVIALTPLHDEVTVRSLQAWRARGRSVAVVHIDTGDLLDGPASEAERLARRVWRLDLERRKRALGHLGISVVTMPADGPITPVVTALRRARRAPAVRAGRVGAS